MKKVLLVAVLLIMAMGLMAMDHVHGKVQTNTGEGLSARVTISCYNGIGWQEVSAYGEPNNPETGYFNIELDGYVTPGFTYKATAVLEDGRTASKIWTTTSGDQYGIYITFLPVAQH